MGSQVNGGEVLSPHPLANALPSLLLLTFLFFLNFTSRVILSPLLPELSRDININHTESGALFLFLTCGYFFSILFSTFVSSRIGHKQTIVTSLVAVGAVLLFLASSMSLTTLYLSMFLLGTAAGLYLPSGLATISHLVPSGYLGRGMAIHEFAPNLGFVAAPLIAHLMIVSLGSWRQGLIYLGCVVILLGSIYGFYGASVKQHFPPFVFKEYKKVLGQRQFWMISVLFSMAICSTLGVYSMLPLLLTESHGMSIGESNTLLSISRISAVLMPMVGGWLGDRFGHSRLMLAALGITGMLTIPLGLLDGNLFIVMVVFQPLVAVCFFPSVFATLAGMNLSENKGVAVTLCVPIAFLIGAGILPTCIGFIGDNYSLDAGFVFVGVCMLSAVLISFPLMLEKNE